MRRFREQTVVITGAAGSLGRAAAARFAREGAQLALLDWDRAQVAQVAADLSRQGYPTLALPVNVADEAEVAAAIGRAEAEFGHLDVFFNNAGIGGLDRTVAELPAEEWDAVLAINLRGVFFCCKHGVPALKRAGGGAIVNMGSSTGRHDTLPGSAPYMASKAGVEALTRSLALQVARWNIRVNAICPGIIETPLSLGQKDGAEQQHFFRKFAERIPLGRVGQPADVAAAVAFLASAQASQITGTSLLIDGGQTLRRWISAPDLPACLP